MTLSDSVPLTPAGAARICPICEGRTWVYNGDLDDGMLTGRDDCPTCAGTGQLSAERCNRAGPRVPQRARSGGGR